MTLANQISRDTDRYSPEIERHDGGDLTIRWPIIQPWGKLSITRLARVAGIDTGLFSKSLWRGYIYLHMPAEIADCH